MHIVGLPSVNAHNEEEKATNYFQANIMDEAVVEEEYVFKCRY